MSLLQEWQAEIKIKYLNKLSTPHKIPSNKAQKQFKHRSSFTFLWLFTLPSGNIAQSVSFFSLDVCRIWDVLLSFLKLTLIVTTEPVCTC